MKQFMLLVALVLVVSVLAPYAAGWADDSTTGTSGQVSLQLTQNLYCGIKSAFASPTAMFIGLAMAIFGLFKLIQGEIGGGIMLIAAGAMLSAIPSLAESFLNGVGGSIGSLTASPTIQTPKC